jgi:hypothetical protein
MNQPSAAGRDAYEDVSHRMPGSRLQLLLFLLCVQSDRMPLTPVFMGCSIALQDADAVNGF